MLFVKYIKLYLPNLNCLIIGRPTASVLLQHRFLQTEDADDEEVTLESNMGSKIVSDQV